MASRRASGDVAQMEVEVAPANDADDLIYEEEQTWESIDALAQFGVSASDIKKAKEAGFATVQSVFMNPKKELLAVRGLSDTKVDKMIEAAGKVTNVGSGAFCSGVQYMEKRKNVIHLNTGCKALNDILNGGVETQCITEVYGEFRTGKSQLCHTLCVTTQMPIRDESGEPCGGGNGKCAYIDTEGSFRPDRVRLIAERFGLPAEEVLQNVSVARVHTFDQQANALTQIAAMMASEGPYRCLIIDSIMCALRAEYTGRGTLSERQQLLGQMMSKLRKISEEFNCAVFITNQVMADPSGMSFAGADPKKPVGGHVLAHASTIRLSVRKGKGEQRIAKIVDAPDLAEKEATFSILEGGVSDAAD